METDLVFRNVSEYAAEPIIILSKFLNDGPSGRREEVETVIKCFPFLIDTVEDMLGIVSGKSAAADLERYDHLCGAFSALRIQIEQYIAQYIG